MEATGWEVDRLHIEHVVEWVLVLGQYGSAQADHSLAHSTEMVVGVVKVLSEVGIDGMHAIVKDVGVAFFQHSLGSTFHAYQKIAIVTADLMNCQVELVARVERNLAHLGVHITNSGHGLVVQDRFHKLENGRLRGVTDCVSVFWDLL